MTVAADCMAPTMYSIIAMYVSVSGNAAGHDRQGDERGAGFLRDQPGNLFRELRLTYDKLHPVGFHRPDQLLDMPRRRVDARPQLDGADIPQAEAFGEVGPVLVIRYKLKARERLRSLPPIGYFIIELPEVGVAVAREVGFILWIEGDEGLADFLDGRLCQDRIEHVVGIAVRAHVPAE